MTIDERGRFARLPVVEATEAAAAEESFMAHGEPPAADALRQRMEREFGWVCQVPEILETVELA